VDGAVDLDLLVVERLAAQVEAPRHRRGDLHDRATLALDERGLSIDPQVARCPLLGREAFARPCGPGAFAEAFGASDVEGVSLRLALFDDPAGVDSA
jgi:hypothetical protein